MEKTKGFIKLQRSFKENINNVDERNTDYISALGLLMVMMYNSFQDKGCCYVDASYNRLMELARMSRPTLSKHLNKLEEKGWIKRDRRYNKANRYQLLCCCSFNNNITKPKKV